MTETCDTYPPEAYPPEAVMNAARSGDTAALRALADFHRERGWDKSGWGESDAGLAYQFEALALETEVRHRQAVQLRRLLELLECGEAPEVPSVPLPPVDAFRRHLDWYGLPVEIYPARWNQSAQPDDTQSLGWGAGIANAVGWVIIAPTDGQEESRTRERLLGHFGAAFPAVGPFKVAFKNEPLTWAGEATLFVLGLRA